jgi:hypothetical protein
MMNLLECGAHGSEKGCWKRVVYSEGVCGHFGLASKERERVRVRVKV